jgi:glycosyltransferase involved in cell wall biosynthesis
MKPNLNMKSESLIPQPTLSPIQSKKILAILPALIPSTTILVVEPLMHLVNLGHIELRVRLEYLYVRHSDLEWADLVVFCRNTEPVYNVLETVSSFGKPYIYELDDNFFELSLDLPEGKYHRTPERISQLENYIQNASLVRAYSLPLEMRIRQYTPNVKFVKAPVNLFSVPSVPPKRRSENLKIVFSTSRTISDDLSQIFVKDISRILKEYGNRVEVHFWGFIPEELKGLPSVKFHRFMPNYKKYLQAMYKEGYDIGLAPMKNDLFHNSKTNNKFREYGACWIAGIYSNTDIYSNCVIDGKNGLLVSNKEGSWYQAIARLMSDSHLRQSIQADARTLVEREYSLHSFALLLLHDIDQVLSTFGKPTTSENNYQKPTRIFYQIIQMPVSGSKKVYNAIRNYGLATTFRLILDQLERYIVYFDLLRRIRRKKI